MMEGPEADPISCNVHSIASHPATLGIHSGTKGPFSNRTCNMVGRAGVLVVDCGSQLVRVSITRTNIVMVHLARPTGSFSERLGESRHGDGVVAFLVGLDGGRVVEAGEFLQVGGEDEVGVEGLFPGDFLA